MTNPDVIPTIPGLLIAAALVVVWIIQARNAARRR